MFDLVICHGPNDNNILNYNLKYNSKTIDFRNVYVITYDPNLRRDDCIVVHESAFPFNKESFNALIPNIHPEHLKRRGWYLQQLLKLYAWKYIDGLLPNYLVIDCDTIFIKKTDFFKDGKYLFNYAKNNTSSRGNPQPNANWLHKPYFEHINKMLPSFKKFSNEISGICHHMLFSKDIIKEIFEVIEKQHDNKYQFWEIFIKNINVKNFCHSMASEYELYFHYIFTFHNNKVELRRLNWIDDVSTLNQLNSILQKGLQEDINYVSCHWWRKGR